MGDQLISAVNLKEVLDNILKAGLAKFDWRWLPKYNNLVAPQ